MNGLVKLALSLANVPEALVTDIDKNLPGAERLIAAAREAQPHIEALLPMVDEANKLLARAQPHIDALVPIAKRINPDLKSVLPVLHGAVAFVEGKTKSS